MKWKKWIPLLILILLILAAYFSGAADYLTFNSIKANRALTQLRIAKQPILMPILFILLYVIAMALSFPVATVLTLLGGFFFGLISAFYVVAAATIGASLIFLIAKTAFGDLLKKKAGPFLAKMEQGFNQNAVSYLLFLRFIPLFPFWLVNLAPAFFNVRLWTYGPV